MNTSEQIDQIAAALAAAWGELGHATQDAENPQWKSGYATLASVIETVRPVYARHGLCVLQSVGTSDSYVRCETSIVHSSGQWVSSGLDLPIGSKLTPQAVGSAITYARRYGLQSLVCVAAADDDDDGNAATSAEPGIGEKASRSWLEDSSLDPSKVDAWLLEHNWPRAHELTRRRHGDMIKHLLGHGLCGVDR